MNIVERLIDHALQGDYKQHGRQTKAAKLLGTSQAQVARLLGGQIPSAETLIDIIGKLGGDIERAMPWWKPEVKVLEETALPLVGSVSAGGACEVFPNPMDYLTIKDLVGESPYFHITTKRDISMIRIRGNSMEPEYPEDSILLCAPPADPTIIPARCPVIATIGTTSTFKLYTKRKIHGKPTIELIPINHHHDTQFYKPEDVTVQFVALKVLK